VKKRYATSPSVYGYFIEIALNAAATETTEDDLVGTLTVKKSTDSDYKLDIGGKNYFDLAVNLAIVYKNSLLDADSNMTTITENKRLFNFDEDTYDDEDEYELEFSQIPDAYWGVDVTSQGKVILACDTKFNATVASKYPMANLDFINGNGGSFNKIGELFLPAESGSYLYLLNSDGTLSMSNAEYERLSGKCELYRMLDAGLADAASGKSRKAKDVFSDLERKHGLGKV
jgi:hypothetical protein